MSPQIGVVHHTGHFVYVIAVHSKSACSPNFEGFPWGMQVIWVLPPRFPVRFAVFSLGRGSTASMGLSTGCLGIAPLASPISNPLLGGRSLLQRNPKTLFTSSQVVNTKSRLVSGLARNPLVILTLFSFFNIFSIPLLSIKFLSFYLIAANRCCSASLQLKGIGACLRYRNQPISSLTTLVSSARPTLTAHLGSSERLTIEIY